MAFKASRPARSAESQSLPVEAPVAATSGSLSIDELVGAPQKTVESGITNQESGETKKGTEESSVLTPTPVGERPIVHPEQPRGERRFPDRPASTQRGEPASPQFQRGEPMGYNRPGSGYSSGGGYHRDFGHRSGGFRRDGGSFRSSGGFSAPSGGYRQDSGNGDSYRPGGGNYTQDVGVPTETVRGVLDTMPEGHGFLRPKYTPGDADIYISQSQIRRFLLRNGDMVEGQARPPKENERYWGLLKVEKINEQAAETMEQRPKFEDLVPVYPNKILTLETGQLPLSTRIMDLVSPIGFGQRGLVVSPPKAGKTTILKELAAGIAANYPGVHLMAALIGERPEEVTDISRSIKGEVFASNFDESPAEQTRIAEVALDRAKRLVEMGKDVVILLDSITRLARAYNLVVNPSGRTLSGGFDPAALYPAKKFLGAARCVEKQREAISDKKEEGEQQDEVKQASSGGSLTVIGTALVDTGSRMDDLIYEEFKGTGNMELHLSRGLQERRIFPAIDLVRSGTRHDELLLGEDTMKKISTLRHMLSLLGDEERTMMMIDRLGKTKTNLEFLDSLGKG